MSTPAPKWMPEQCKLSYPSWVQRKAVTLCKRDPAAATGGQSSDDNYAAQGQNPDGSTDAQCNDDSLAGDPPAQQPIHRPPNQPSNQPISAETR